MKSALKALIFLTLITFIIPAVVDARKQTDSRKPAGVKIVLLEGIVKVTIGGKLIVINPGDDIPELGDSASFKVLYGKVLIQMGEQSIITAEAGAIFSVSVSKSGDDPAVVSVQIERGSRFIEVSAGEETINMSRAAAVDEAVEVGVKASVRACDMSVIEPSAREKWKGKDANEWTVIKMETGFALCLFSNRYLLFGETVDSLVSVEEKAGGIKVTFGGEHVRTYFVDLQDLLSKSRPYRGYPAETNCWAMMTYDKSVSAKVTIPEADVVAPKIPAGKVFTTEGKVEWLKAGTPKWERIKAPFVIGQGDRIRTGRRSKAEIFIRHGSKVRLSGRTTFALEKVSRGENMVKVLVGRLELWVKKLYKRRFGVRTPTAVAAVRGTNFTVDVDRSGRTVWDVFSGSIDIFDFYNHSINLRENQRLIVTKAKGAVKTPDILPEHIKPPVEPETIAEEKMEIEAEAKKTKADIEAEIKAEAEAEPEKEAEPEEEPVTGEPSAPEGDEGIFDEEYIPPEIPVIPTQEIEEETRIVSPSSP